MLIVGVVFKLKVPPCRAGIFSPFFKPPEASVKRVRSESHAKRRAAQKDIFFVFFQINK